MNTGILGIGKFLPPATLTNDDLIARGLNTSDEWIMERVGIKERRVVDEETATSDLAYEAAVSALQSARVQPQDIDVIIVATSTPDYPLFPSTACLLQHRLGIKSCPAFDISAACTGFNYAVETASNFIKAGSARYALVIAADCLSKYVDWENRSVCVLFGDGAGAAVLGLVKPGFGILYSRLYSNGEHAPILMVKGGGSRHKISMEILEKKEHTIFMNGRSVFKIAVSNSVEAVKTALTDSKLEASDIKLFLFHQANQRIIKLTEETLGLKSEQCFTNIYKYGNTSAASIPVALRECEEERRISEGDILLLAGFGAGFTWGVTILRWGGRE